MTLRIAYLPGDGIGPEVLAVARDVVLATGADVTFVEGAVGWECFADGGDALPAATLALARSCDATLLGAVTSRPDAEVKALGFTRPFRSPIVRLRQELDLHTCLRPVAPLGPQAPGGRGLLDVLIVRENTEGLYSGLDIRPVPAELRQLLDRHAGRAVLAGREDEIALTVRLVSRRAVERVATIAFTEARKRRGRVTLAEKPSVMRASGGLFLEATRDVAARFQDVAFAWENADAVCMRLAQEPARYDVLLAGNLFGDLLSDLACGLASVHGGRGGLGGLPSANVGESHALFEPAHGSAPDIAGRGIANPVAAVLAAAMLLDRAGLAREAGAVRRAVHDLVRDGSVLTPDWNGTSSTADVARALLRRVAAGRPKEPAR
jgi:3-isopropylmalate dehydrogenase